MDVGGKESKIALSAIYCGPGCTTTKSNKDVMVKFEAGKSRNSARLHKDCEFVYTHLTTSKYNRTVGCKVTALCCARCVDARHACEHVLCCARCVDARHAHRAAAVRCCSSFSCYLATTRQPPQSCQRSGAAISQWRALNLCRWVPSVCHSLLSLSSRISARPIDLQLFSARAATRARRVSRDKGPWRGASVASRTRRPQKAPIK